MAVPPVTLPSPANLYAAHGLSADVSQSADLYALHVRTGNVQQSGEGGTVEFSPERLPVPQGARPKSVLR